MQEPFFRLEACNIKIETPTQLFSCEFCKFYGASVAECTNFWLAFYSSYCFSNPMETKHLSGASKAATGGVL